MQKCSLLILSVLFITVVLLGCQLNASSKDSDHKLSIVNISNSKALGAVNNDFFATYTDDETLKIIDKAISNAVKLEGIVNVIEPEFDLEVIYKDGKKQGFHLWLGEIDGISTLMKIDDTHVVYYILEELTNQLIHLLK